jgi:hypothetical protein
MSGVDEDYIDGVLADIEDGHAGARLAALEQLVMVLVYKAGGKVTVTAAEVDEIRRRKPTMYRTPPEPNPAWFDLELIDEEGRTWNGP